MGDHSEGFWEDFRGFRGGRSRVLAPGQDFLRLGDVRWSRWLGRRVYPSAGSDFRRDVMVLAVLDRPPWEWIPAVYQRHWGFGGGKGVPAHMRWWWHGWVPQWGCRHSHGVAWGALMLWLHEKGETIPTVENVAVGLKEGYYLGLRHPPVASGMHSELTEGCILGALWIMQEARSKLVDFLERIGKDLPESARSARDVVGLQADVYKTAMEIALAEEQGAGARVAALETARRTVGDVARVLGLMVERAAVRPEERERLREGAKAILKEVQGGSGQFSRRAGPNVV